MNPRVRRILWTALASIGGCAASPTNPAFPITSTQAHRAIEQMRHDPVPLQRPLVVVGGILDPEFSSQILAGFYRDMTQNATIIPVAIGFCGSFGDCRRCIIDAVDKACPPSDPQWTREVDVVGASLGGLAARYSAAPSPDPAHPRRLKIARLFSIASPHAGAKLARVFPLTDYLRSMRPGSPFLKTLSEEDSLATYQLYPYVQLNDEVVGDRYAAPPGMNVYWLPNTSILPAHIAAMADERILGDIARRLRGEETFTQSPPTPLPGP